eukprot:TRINITY_DN10038_c0_g1_i1.p1 TRINITY_DN10038_c0_g1~~TRINITY_DN10038_c0_g1_i1.p1  ORF type:complete len:306 (-),score=32.99 TRINITY_DN10038_c0_g1_i1:1035-1886(-)
MHNPANCNDKDLGSKPEVAQRLKVASQAWSALWLFWTNRAVTLKIRAHIYRALVFSRLITGLTTFVLSTSLEKKLEVWHLNKLRTLMLGSAVALTNREVRIACGIPSVHAALLRGRLKFVQRLALHPQVHAACSGALAGTIKGGQEQLRGKVPDDRANPWLLQFWKDLQIAAQTSDQLNSDLSRYGWKELYKSHALQTLDFSKLPFFSTPCDAEIRVHSHESCRCWCGHLCTSNASFAMHAFRAHHVQMYLFRFVQSNECPSCLQVLASKRQARLHLIRHFPH